jgi:2-oxoglutarate dehydrogenase E2 component (dihydrolipoamide succinyltransferase)
MMKVDVIMPQMGESIAEGTISKWLKQIGDLVERDEPLLEISTDKVDAEIPSPAAGCLVAVTHREGETVPVNEVIAVIETDSQVTAEPLDMTQAPAAPEPSAPSAEAATTISVERIPTAERLKQMRSSPLIRRMAREHGIDISQIPGTGLGGRVTKRDILSYLENRAAMAVREERPQPEAPVEGFLELPAMTPLVVEERMRIEPMSAMRKKIAEHMVLSRRTAAHVTTVFEIDMTRIVRLREQFKEKVLERDGLKLTYMPFIAKACIDAIKAYPILNASVNGDTILYKKDINLGIAVALDWGLIVPVVKQADEKSLLGLARAMQDLADRARRKQLKPEDVQGGTFTITNPGIFGSLFGTPIINQPQVAILGVGVIAKRPVVIDDAIAIRSMAYFALSFDHRLIDGAVADQFMSHIKRTLENFEPLGL